MNLCFFLAMIPDCSSFGFGDIRKQNSSGLKKNHHVECYPFFHFNRIFFQVNMKIYLYIFLKIGVIAHFDKISFKNITSVYEWR